MIKERTKKICFVLPSCDRTSHFVYVKELVDSLATFFDITLIIEKPTDAYRGSIVNVTTQRFAFMPVRIFENLFILIRARMSGCRVFYIHYSFVAAINASLVARLSGGTVYYWNAGIPWQYKRNFIRELFERLAYKLIHHLVTGAEALRHGYASYYGIPESSIICLPNWIDVRAFSQIELSDVDKYRKQIGVTASGLVVLFLHTLAKRKGARHLPMFAEHIATYPDATFVIAGGGPDEAFVKNEIERRTISHRVIMLGPVVHVDVKKLFALADIFILPSEEEGFPHVLLESMATATPFVTFDVGGVRDIVGPELVQWVVPADDIDAFTDRLACLLESADERTTAGTNARTRVYRYDKEVVIAQFAKLLENA